MKLNYVAGIVATLIIAAVLPLTGCARNAGKAAATDAPALCGACGQEKGAANCCAKDAAKCGHCGKIKGSPGCCKP